MKTFAITVALLIFAAHSSAQWSCLVSGDSLACQRTPETELASIAAHEFLLPDFSSFVPAHRYAAELAETHWPELLVRFDGDRVYYPRELVRLVGLYPQSGAHQIREAALVGVLRDVIASLRYARVVSVPDGRGGRSYDLQVSNFLGGLVLRDLRPYFQQEDLLEIATSPRQIADDLPDLPPDDEWNALFLRYIDSLPEGDQREDAEEVVESASEVLR